MTNYERLQRMSIPEKAQWILDRISDCEKCPACIPEGPGACMCGEPFPEQCFAVIWGWLESEVQDKYSTC